MAPTSLEREPRVLSKADLKLARDASAALSGYLAEELIGPVVVEVRPERAGKSYPLTVPAPVFQMLADILAQMAEGRAVAVMPYHVELTTQQAAEMLHVSRPYLIKLLEAGAIPYRKVGPRRRIKFSDLMAYKQRDDLRRREAVRELTREAERLGLGY